MKSPKYNPTLGAGYDIALIKLKTAQQFKPVDTPEGLHPICVPDWGDFKYKITSDCQLENDKISKMDDDKCSDQYKKRFNPTNMICAEVSTNQRKRNHGSPFVCLDSNDDKKNTDSHWNKRLYLAGIASWPLTEASRQKLDVFTKLYSDNYSNDYPKWINKTINDKPLLV